MAQTTVLPVAHEWYFGKRIHTMFDNMLFTHSSYCISFYTLFVHWSLTTKHQNVTNDKEK